MEREIWKLIERRLLDAELNLSVSELEEAIRDEMRDMARWLVEKFYEAQAEEEA